MGAEKMDLQKRGAAHCFFHFLAPIFFFEISWAPRPSCAHRFFRFLVPINFNENNAHQAPMFLGMPIFYNS